MNENTNGEPSTENTEATQVEKQTWDKTVATLEGETLVGDDKTGKIKLPPPLRFIFGDMLGVVILVWLPVFLAFFIPWELYGLNIKLGKQLTLGMLFSALIIALPPWIILSRHLLRGRLWDGIIEMFLWAIWECGAVIFLSYLHPEQAEKVIWNASAYWESMSHWIQTGQGMEADPSLWLPQHALHVVMLVIGAFILGLPALMLGVLQLNYMNYYVAMCMLESSRPLLTMGVAWHFWSVIRVAGFIILASSIYQLELLLTDARRAAVVIRTVWGGIIIGILLVILDAILKWKFASTINLILNGLMDR